MSLMEKIKNIFIIEEDVVEERPERKIAKKIDLPTYEDVEEELDVPVEETVSFRESELLIPETEFEMFDDGDFFVKEEPKEEVIKPEIKPDKSYGGSLYGGNTEIKTTYSKEEKKQFRPTPIISPIHGIIDNNEGYVPNIPVKTTTISYETEEADLDIIRNKAYGGMFAGLSYEDEEPEVLKEEPLIEDNLLYSLEHEEVEDETPKVETVSIADAEEYFEDLGLEYNIDYKDESQEKATGRRTAKKQNLTKDTIDLEEELVIEDEPKETNKELDDDLFDLIDLMYESEED